MYDDFEDLIDWDAGQNTCDEYSHFLGFSNDQERDNWISENGG